MKIITERAQGEIVEKKSRFIATLQPVETKEEAEAFVAECKKKYWDARHNCSAYVIGENNEIMHSSDDGEPSGTAGRPMLAVLTGADIHNVAVVVTRYFGGVLLGTGGLVRAYQGAVQEAIAGADVVEQIAKDLLVLRIGYNEVGKLQNYLANNPDLKQEDSTYEADVVLYISVPKELVEKTQKDIVQLTSGKAVMEVEEDFE